MKLVYLDQSYWGRLASSHRDLREELARCSARGAAMFPLSSIHWFETMKAAPEIRAGLVPVFEALARGHCLLNPIDVMRLEYRRHAQRRTRDWLRERMVTTDWSLMLGPRGKWWTVPFFWLLRRFITPRMYMQSLASTPGSAESTRRVNAILARGASSASGPLSSRRIDRSSIAMALGIQPSALPNAADELAAVFPSVAIRERLQDAIRAAVPTGLAANDLVDVTFLASTLAYFDIVTVDRAMGARVREAGLGELQAATVVSRIEDLGPAVGRAS